MQCLLTGAVISLATKHTLSLGNVRGEIELQHSVEEQSNTNNTKKGKPHLELGDAAADLSHNTGDLVARQARVLCVLPLVQELVQVRVADAAVRNLQDTVEDCDDLLQETYRSRNISALLHTATGIRAPREVDSRWAAIWMLVLSSWALGSCTSPACGCRWRRAGGG